MLFSKVQKRKRKKKNNRNNHWLYHDPCIYNRLLIHYLCLLLWESEVTQKHAVFVSLCLSNIQFHSNLINTLHKDTLNWTTCICGWLKEGPVIFFLYKPPQLFAVWYECNVYATLVCHQTLDKRWMECISFAIDLTPPLLIKMSL